MSPTVLGTPSEVVSTRVARSIGTGPYDARYKESELHRYRIRIPNPAPAELRVVLTFGQEPEGVWAHIEELDVSAEGEDLYDAFRNVLSAAHDWLGYVRDESPELASELAGQKRYVALLDAPAFSWFREIRFAE
jgi:hypothetical protein